MNRYEQYLANRLQPTPPTIIHGPMCAADAIAYFREHLPDIILSRFTAWVQDRVSAGHYEFEYDAHRELWRAYSCATPIQGE